MVTLILSEMVNVVVQDLLSEGGVNMLKKILDLVAILVIVIGLASCASGGGSAGITASPTPPPSGGSTGTTPTDERIPFEEFSYTYYPNIEGYSDSVVVTYGMTDFTTTGLPSPTEKFKIADYGFFEVTVTGNHNGCPESDCGAESVDPRHFTTHTNIWEADLNGDGHMDFYLMPLINGDTEFIPESRLMAFINDGNGHFKLSNEIFEGSNCLYGGGPWYSNVRSEHGDPYRDCGWSNSHRGGQTADFNGDGITDLFLGSSLMLSNNGKIVNVSHSNLPNELFFNEDLGPLFFHDTAIGDADGDGDTDIFLPIADYSYGNACDSCLEYIPWAMLMNDGSGNFTANQNFPKIPNPEDVGQTELFWATTAAVADFDNDGFGDVAVGWFNPHLAREYGFGETYENSAGAVFFNDGNNDWRNRAWVELPNNYFGENGNANDMQAFDFDGDGYIDIVMATTRRDPYYKGRMIQFFKNNGGTSFTDMTSTYGTTKYADGGITNPNLWNGEGDLIIVDFDHDGDLDIVDSSMDTYVLLNDNGSFRLYDDFPKFGNKGLTYFPVEIDGEHWYDFIGYKWSEETVNGIPSRTLTFFQVLDPPFAEMQQDIVTKPKGYFNDVYNDLLRYKDIRKQTMYNTLFYNKFDNSELIGYSHNFNKYGLTVGQSSGNSNGGFITLDYEDDEIHFGVSYIQNSVDAKNKTKWYGTGHAEVDYSTFMTFTEFRHVFNNGIFARSGATLSFTDVEGFHEEGSSYDVKINGTSMNMFSVFADINYVYNSVLGQTFLSTGVDFYNTFEDTNINFQNVLEYEYNRDEVITNFTLTHVYKMFYATAKINSNNMNSYEIGFNVRF